MTLHAYLLSLALACPGPRDDAYRDELVLTILREPVTVAEARELLAIAFYEAPLSPPLPSGCWPSCSCDGGLATGPFQLHDPTASPLLLLRTVPYGWTTYPRAHQLADRWARQHPFTPDPDHDAPPAPALERAPTHGPATAPALLDEDTP